MLWMPREGLSTWADLAVVSTKFRIVLDAVDGVVRAVPSVELTGRRQRYRKGVM